MTFDAPISLRDALARLDELRAIPTDLSSAGIRDQWTQDLRDRALFSARTTKADILQGYAERIEDFLRGETNLATARAQMQDLYDSLEYHPQTGFPGDEGRGIPPAEPGTLRDLSSKERIDLALRTNVRQVANFAFDQAQNSPDALYWYPAYELIRVAPRYTPRGYRRGKGGALMPDPGHDWPARWEKAGGQFYDGRMIARKDDPIWRTLGDSGLFSDGLGAGYPPFAFNSGYGWQLVSRRECVALGVIDAVQNVSPSDARMNEGLQASARGLSDAALRSIGAGLKTEIDAGNIALKEIGYDLKTGRYVK